MENVRAVERALELLDCIADARKAIGLSELSRNLVLPKATVLRLARTLESKGYLIQDAEFQTYRLGPKVLHLGKAFLDDLDFRRVALPFMKELRDQVQEAVSLYIVHGHERMCVQRVESQQILRQVIAVGERLPLNRGAAGKLLVAYNNESAAVEGVSEEEIHEIIDQGFAISREEREQGLAAIAAPVRNNRGQVIAALTLSGPAFRYQGDNYNIYLQKVIETANEISYQLGYLK